MNNRERFHAVLNGLPFDRLPIIEWAEWWDQTIARWHREGLPADITNRYDICEHFGLDVLWQDWWCPTAQGAPAPAYHGAGIVASEADYERLRPFFFQIRDRWPLNPEVWEAAAVRQQAGDWVLWFTVEGFFWYPRTLLGIERHLFAFYDQPELIHRINQDLADWMVKLIDRVTAICTPDFMTFAEDLSYNHGPMLSEAQFDEFLLPYYRRVTAVLRERGILPIVDSDGDITTATPWFERAGVRGILPLERQAGVDLPALRAAHPDMVWIGGFDKMTMSRGETAMRAEFERLLPASGQGRCLLSCDHQTPPGVSYADYQTYLRLFREYAAESARRFATSQKQRR